MIDDITGPIDPLQLNLAYRPCATLEQNFQELKKFAQSSSASSDLVVFVFSPEPR